MAAWREKLVKIGGKVVCSARYVTFQLAEVAVSRRLFATILQRIGRLRSPLLVPGDKVYGQHLKQGSQTPCEDGGGIPQQAILAALSGLRRVRKL